MAYFFCGTTTGDILCINKVTNILQFEVPAKNKFSLGVTALSFVKMSDKGFNMLVGTGSGIVANYDIGVAFENGNKVKAIFKHRQDLFNPIGIKINSLRPWKHDVESSAITSIAKRGAGHQFLLAQLTLKCTSSSIPTSQLSSSKHVTQVLSLMLFSHMVFLS
ncbi:Cilia- and flagella-associated protein 52 [Bulinus truncatus]|nr:Cilia- and flagella-associated protein 52 [Bulinus truncatus]